MLTGAKNQLIFQAYPRLTERIHRLTGQHGAFSNNLEKIQGIIRKVFKLEKLTFNIIEVKIKQIKLKRRRIRDAYKCIWYSYKI